jgi:preprotein translocase subunit YajC
MKGAGNLVFLLIIVAVFAIMIRTQRRRQRTAMEVQQDVVPGARVMTTAGLYATVVSISDTEVDLEVAPGVVSTYARAAIARVITPGADDGPEALNGEGSDSPYEDDD